jgi:hypothetical protein
MESAPCPALAVGYVAQLFRRLSGAGGMQSDSNVYIFTGQDLSSLFPDVVSCMDIQILEVKKMV